MIIRPTKALMKEMNTNVDALPNIEQDEMYSWHANNFIMNRKKYIIFVNDKSRLSVTISKIRGNQGKDIKNIFSSALKDYLLVEGFKEKWMDSYIGEISDIKISNTNNRSVLGTMVEAVKLMDSIYSRGAIPDFHELNKENNRIIYKPIDYLKPIDVFNELIKEYHGS
ncbi:DUF6933 domain-containing protein [Paenibacillus radicis (ex Xue et al. 2023)]|uniref:DUF6933 domain-containing protein n=1 Tax=Paenibacillus radicis (ex Xue et al. 2023) TaxID=2972489 RepID=A0ABT1YBT6_9BACL|nr:hypothetical protein [Paenibacillus radicis (ex Xue et al. 2023)]MCR8630655.1 hypothetical protein [Paenibacillus radicis (ex Xue et al. 2023)]